MDYFFPFKKRILKNIKNLKNFKKRMGNEEWGDWGDCFCFNYLVSITTRAFVFLAKFIIAKIFETRT